MKILERLLIGTVKGFLVGALIGLALVKSDVPGSVIVLLSVVLTAELIGWSWFERWHMGAS